MIRILPNDHKQALRVKRILIALGGYTWLFLVLLYAYDYGFARDLSLDQYLIIYPLYIFLSYSVILTLIYTGVNRKFKDPSMTMAQCLVGILCFAIIAFFAQGYVRGLAMLGYITVMFFGIFRLQTRNFLMLVAVSVISYCGAVILVSHFSPEDVHIPSEILRIFSLVFVLGYIAFLCNYISGLRRRINHMATYDPLTRVYNRWEAMGLLNREKAFSARTGIPFSICIIDLDDFKQINDTYGHLAGDEVLKAVAGSLQASIRSEDYVARFGGEEFIVVFVNFECQGVESSNIQRLLKETEQIRLPDISPSLKVTASIGVAAYQPMESIDDLISRADNALYKAKNAGKNRAEFLPAASR